MPPKLSGLKVCFIAGTLGQGGSERQLYYLIDALVRAGAAVRVLTLTAGEFWESRIASLGARIRWIGGSASRSRRLARILGELRAERTDVLQSQHFYTNLYAVAAGRLMKVREIGAIRGDLRTEVRDTGGLLGQWSLEWPRLLACNSAAAMRDAAGMGVPKDRLALLPNAIDTDAFLPARAHSHGQPVRILAVGRLVKPKRFDRFLSVLGKVKGLVRSPLEAVIAGDGPCRARLEQHAARLNLGGIVKFRGAVSDMTSAYQEADILALTSDHEGSPNAVLEGMACGLPVVATAVGSVPDLVREGETGYVCHLDDEDGMAHRLAALVECRPLRQKMGAQARESVQENYSLERLPYALESLYEAALS